LNDLARIVEKKYPWIILVAFIFARLIIFLSSTLEGIQGYGDFIHFYRLASLPGWPFINYWVEFPPLFPFLIAIIFRAAGGVEHTFDYLLLFILTLADAGNLYLFVKLIRLSRKNNSWIWRLAAYFIILLTLAYSWWYFDPLAVFFMLLGIYLLLSHRQSYAGIAFGVGLLVKLFPVIGLIAMWRFVNLRKAIKVAGIALGIGILAYGSLFLISPKFTSASLQSQTAKGSWETVWALIDNNYTTGNFGPETERLDASRAGVTHRNPPVISSWLTFLIFAAIGIAGMLKLHPDNPLQSLSLIGMAWCLFLIWSPGWSPQWILYLLPLILIVFPEQNAFLLAAVIILINLLEWPILLSRGWFWSLSLTIPLRTLILGLLAVLFYQQASRPIQAPALIATGKYRDAGR
jgi:hypothetical protein